MEPEECGNCKYWGMLEVNGKLVCKRNPPLVVVIGSYIHSHWPEPKKKDWCGKWKDEKEAC